MPMFREFVSLARFARDLASTLSREQLDQIGKSELRSQLRKTLGKPDLILGKLLYTHTLPFLRRADLLLKALDIFLPMIAQSTSDIDQSEFAHLLTRFGVPLPTEIYRGDNSTGTLAFRTRLKLWLGAAMQVFRPKDVSDPTLEYPSFYELAPLPSRLDVLIHEIQSRRCPRCKSVPPEPAICLLCGDLVCYQSFCCMDTTQDEPLHGECNTHMWT